MKVSDLLSENNVIPVLEVKTKAEALEKLVQTIRKTADEEIMQKALNAVMERESIMSTGVGKGLAIPHGRIPGIQCNYAAFARLSDGIEYGSIDGKPVSMIFLLVGPETQNSLHIKMLSRISRLMNNDDFRSHLLELTTPAEIIAFFHQEENRFI